MTLTQTYVSVIEQKPYFSGLNYTGNFDDSEDFDDNRTAYLILEIVEVSVASFIGILVNLSLRE